MRSPSTSRSGWLVALGLVTLLVLALGSPAVGGPRLLTVSQAKKVFLTKKAAAKTYLRKTRAASFLTPAKGDARYLRLAGETRAVLAPGSWTLVGTNPDLVVSHQPYATTVGASGVPVSNADLFAAVPVPTVVSGRTTTVVGLEVCYEFPPTALNQPQLDRITLQRAAGTAADPVGGALSNLVVDETGRLDGACTTLRFDPVPLAPSDAVGIGLRFDFIEANTLVRVGRGSLLLAR